MPITKVFRSGNSQAVRIPRRFHMEAGQVEILQRGDELVLRTPPRSLALAFDVLTELSPDCFRSPRRQPKLDRRTGL